jgi:hypothetical protein
MICNLLQIAGSPLKKYEIDGTRGTYWGGERCVQDFDGET